MPTTSPLVIRTSAELEAAFEAYLSDPATAIVPTIESGCILTVKLDGPDWDGTVDARIAKYVIEAQEAYERVAKKTGLLSDKRQYIQLKIQPGCTDGSIDVLSVLTPYLNQMTSAQIFWLFITGVLSFAGYHTWRRAMEAREARIKSEENRHSITAMQELSLAAIKSVSELNREADTEKPIRALARRLDESSRVTLGGDGVRRDADSVKDLLTPRRRSAVESIMVDDCYTAIELVINDRRESVTLTRDGLSFPASFRDLSSSDHELLMHELRHLNSGTGVRITVSVDAEYNDRGIQNARIVAINQPPREGSESIASVVE